MHVACGGVLGWAGRTFQSIFGWHREGSTVFTRLVVWRSTSEIEFHFYLRLR